MNETLALASELLQAAYPDTDDNHNNLNFVAHKIGGIKDMPYWASAGMNARVRATGKQLRDLTIGELMGLIKAQEELHARAELSHNNVTGGQI